MRFSISLYKIQNHFFIVKKGERKETKDDKATPPAPQKTPEAGAHNSGPGTRKAYIMFTRPRVKQTKEPGG